MITSLDNFLDKANISVMEELTSIQIKTDSDAIRAEDILLQLKELIIEEKKTYLKGLYHYIKSQLKEYEGNIPTPKVSPIDMLQGLMEEHQHKQSDLSDIAPQSVISEIISGKRELNKQHIQKLAAKYNISPAVFFEKIG